MPELVEARVAVGEAQRPGLAEVLRHVLAEDLEGALDARAGGDGGLGRAAEVRVVEVHEAVHARAHLTALAHLVPLGGDVHRADRLQHAADALGLADDDARHTAHLARLRGDADAAGGADDGHPGLARRAGDLERSRAARLGQAARSEEGSAPDGGEVLAGAGRESVRQPADGATALIEQAGLTGERLAAIHHAHGEVLAVAGAGALDVGDLRTHAVDLGDVPRHAAREVGRVDLGLDRDASGDGVQAAREPQQGRRLSDPNRRTRVPDGDQLCLDIGGQ